jgi:hypothetical protein
MTDPTTFGQEIQGQILDTIRKSQEAVTDALNTWAEAVHSVTPSVPVPPMPFADKLPKPAELVANAYDFAEQLLASQRKFAEDILRATAPVLTPKNGPAPKKPAAAPKS